MREQSDFSSGGVRVDGWLYRRDAPSATAAPVADYLAFLRTHVPA